jgi:hypothetical protein
VGTQILPLAPIPWALGQGPKRQFRSVFLALAPSHASLAPLLRSLALSDGSISSQGARSASRRLLLPLPCRAENGEVGEAPAGQRPERTKRLPLLLDADGWGVRGGGGGALHGGGGVLQARGAPAVHLCRVSLLNVDGLGVRDGGGDGGGEAYAMVVGRARQDEEAPAVRLYRVVLLDGDGRGVNSGGGDRGKGARHGGGGGACQAEEAPIVFLCSAALLDVDGQAVSSGGRGPRTCTELVVEEEK